MRERLAAAEASAAQVGPLRVQLAEALGAADELDELEVRLDAATESLKAIELDGDELQRTLAQQEEDGAAAWREVAEATAAAEAFQAVIESQREQLRERQTELEAARTQAEGETARLQAEVDRLTEEIRERERAVVAPATNGDDRFAALRSASPTPR